MLDKLTGLGEVNDPPITVVEDENISFVRKGDVGGAAHLSLQTSAAPKLAEKCTVGIKDLNSIVIAINHKGFIVFSDHNTIGLIELSVPVAIGTKFINKGPVSIKDLDPVVTGVRHINPVGGVESNSLGGGDLANTGS